MENNHSLNPYSQQVLSDMDRHSFELESTEAADVDAIPLLERGKNVVELSLVKGPSTRHAPSLSTVSHSSAGSVASSSDDARSSKSKSSRLAADLATSTEGEVPNDVLALQEQVGRFREQMAEEECQSAQMTAYRDRVSAELEDLTASLFEEANNMVREEKIKRHHAEQLAAEANMKLDALQTETAWRRSQMSLLKNDQKRTASIHNVHNVHNVQSVQGGHVMSSQSFPPKDFVDNNGSPKGSPGIMHWLRSLNHPETDDVSTITLNDAGDGEVVHYKETDPIVHREFVQWRERPSLDRTVPLIYRIYTQEIEPNFEFSNTTLAAKVLQAVLDDTLLIEEGDKYKPFSRECSLSQAPRLCVYRMKVNDDVWHPISTFARNRIITCADFVTYIRYIQQGLVHRGVHDTWWEIVRLRERMCQARLGVL